MKLNAILVLGILIATIITPKQTSFEPKDFDDNVSVTEIKVAKTDYIEKDNKLDNEESKIVSRGNYERKMIEYTATAYCSCEKCCGKWAKYNKTASGTTPKQGKTIAVDKNVIPLGSKVYIEGYGEYIAEDTGSTIIGNRIDIYFESHQEALNFGRRKVKLSWEVN